MGTKVQKKEVKGIEIKPGMIIEGQDEQGSEVVLIAFPTDKGIAFTNYSENNSCDFDYSVFIVSITRIRDISRGASLTDGYVLWEKEEQVTMEVSMEDIAEKFGVDVKHIRIKP